MNQRAPRLQIPTNMRQGNERAPHVHTRHRLKGAARKISPVSADSARKVVRVESLGAAPPAGAQGLLDNNCRVSTVPISPSTRTSGRISAPVALGKERLVVGHFLFSLWVADQAFNARRVTPVTKISLPSRREAISAPSTVTVLVSSGSQHR